MGRHTNPRDVEAVADDAGAAEVPLGHVWNLFCCEWHLENEVKVCRPSFS